MHARPSAFLAVSEATAMDSGKRPTELESPNKRFKENDQLIEEFPNRKIPRIGKISDASYALVERAREMEDKCLKMSDELGSSDRIKMEEKCRCLEAEKRNLASDLEKAAHRCDEWLQKLQAAEAEIESLKSFLKRRDEKIIELGRDKMKMTEELRVWVLKMEEAVNNFTRPKGNRDLQNSGGKKRLEGNEKMKAAVFHQKIRVSEGGKGGMELEDCTLERDVSLKKEKVVCNNAALEAKEKKITELLQRIEVLEKENRVAIGASNANQEKSEFERKLKEEQEKKNLELVHRIGILEKEKRDLEEDIRQKDEVIQVLAPENDLLENKIKELNTGVHKRAVRSDTDAELTQRIRLAKDGCTSGTLTQSQGKKSACFPHSDEQSRSLSYGNSVNVKVKNERENKAGNTRKGHC